MAFMSGITGIFRRDGKDVDPSDIKKMNDKIAHRGPDGSKVWCEGPVAFGHQMLHTTPESLHEILPFEDEESGLVITADARIDNREDLAPKLGIEDNEHVSDSYFILKAYEKWGDKCPEELLGDFAFAIWDKNRETLFCARDHMGVKPFYYFLSDDVFYLSSEKKGLLVANEIPKKINEVRVADYLTFFVNDKEITFYEEIFRLKPAYYVIMDFFNYDERCYWDLNPNQEIIMDSDEEYAEKFLQIFFESVKCRIRSVNDVGSLLSGGLDSSSIVCAVRQILADENLDYSLKTFTAFFDSLPKGVRERICVKKIVDGGKIEPHFINGDQISPLKYIDSMLESMDEPFNTPNLYLNWKLFDEVNKNNVKILLDGFDGDTTVFYYERYLFDLVREMRFKEFLLEIQAFYKTCNLNPFIMFGRTFMPFVPDIVKKVLQKIINSFSINLDLNGNQNFDNINKDLTSRINLKKRFYYLFEQPLKIAKSNKLRHHYHLTSGTMQYILEIADATAAHYSIEPRYPFFDRRLVEFCFHIPKEQKCYRGWDRYIMRRAMDGIIPSEIQWRRKKFGFGLNLRRNLIHDDKLIKKIFSDDSLVKKYVEIDLLRNLYEDYSNGKQVEPIDLFFATVLNLWLHKFEEQYTD